MFFIFFVMFVYSVNFIKLFIYILKSFHGILVEIFERFAFGCRTMLTNSFVNNVFMQTNRAQFSSRMLPVIVFGVYEIPSSVFLDKLESKISGIYTIGPLAFLLTIVLSSFIYFTFLEKNLLFSVSQNINFLKLSSEKQKISNVFTYKLFILKNLVIYSFKQLKLIFFFFSFFIFCFYTFLNYCPLSFNFYFFANYGFVFIFKNMLLIFFAVAFIMFLFFKYGQYYTSVIVSLNYEIPFLFAIAIIIFLFSLQVTHFLLLFLCFEIFSYCLYIIVSVRKQVVDNNNIVNDKISVEAGLKYFVMGSLSSLVLMFGFCLFLLTGNSLTYKSMAFFLHNKVWTAFTLTNDFAPHFHTLETYVCIGFFCLIMYFFFKVSLFPFHWWITEVFNSASLLTIFFISVPVKLISVFLLLHILNFSFYPYFFLFKYIVLFFVPYSLILGTIGMFYTSKIKTFLAFSTIYNMSYVFLLLSISNHSFGLFSLYVFLFGYLVSMLLLLLVLLTFVFITKKEMLYLTDFSFLKFINGILNFYVIFLFFSFLGLPPLAGFWGKYMSLIALLKSMACSYEEKSPYNLLSYFQIISSGMDADKTYSPYMSVPVMLDRFIFGTNISVVLIVITSLICSYIYFRIIRIQIFENLNYLNTFIVDMNKNIKTTFISHFDLFVCFGIISCYTVILPFISFFMFSYFDLYDVQDEEGVADFADQLRILTPRWSPTTWDDLEDELESLLLVDVDNI
jgi:NADH:ubiquinone oxidoreductase subunit 2 (subunit N)